MIPPGCSKAQDLDRAAVVKLVLRHNAHLDVAVFKVEKECEQVEEAQEISRNSNDRAGHGLSSSNPFSFDPALRGPAAGCRGTKLEYIRYDYKYRRIVYDYGLR